MSTRDHRALAELLAKALGDKHPDEATDTELDSVVIEWADSSLEHVRQ